ncbi:MAG: flagellar biosynthesis protein FlhA [Rhodospirillaceae bacterium]|jgi:flagellar biosynthesis protein FlhA|nr:flagellar biosynthesis protein FlhA [Rhodospirillaceae bacterium]MBT5375066.1 flagellar biosynthesis protein FlhA [Rhodospirillaceae bacterium]MBT5753057.1 flagellar biosynthesis protein FlhA [Rhodospirillaceae bacterium]
MSETTTQAQATGGGTDVFSRLGAALRRGDIFFALGVVAILVVLILPMPKWLLDFSLAISITFSVMILLTALFIEKPLDFSSFPTILLIATMLRLSLNLASTRLILSDGHLGPGAAGKVIEAFGGFVMSGNYVIGIIVFAILVIVNFVVITKGSGRIAEVSARFSLDAMPGKQMAIDADLSSGLIDENEARDRRKHLEDESSFFGSMDGAAKFVRGDAVAGLLITFINVIGGIIIGVAQNDLSLAQAADSYTTLTVGDGLVTQIPALIVSTAAGMVVSKAGVVGSADKAIFIQLGRYPRALGISAGLMIILSMAPGIPPVPFLMIAGMMGLLAWTQTQRMINSETQEIETEAVKAEAAVPAEEPVAAALQMDIVRLELGYALLALINNEKGERLTDQIKALRRQLAQEMGFVLPAVRIQDNVQLPSNTYLVRIKEIEAGRGELHPNMLLVMDPNGEQISLPGEETVEPTFGLPAMWVPDEQREEAQFRGYTVVDPPTVITTHLTEIIKDNMPELLSYTESQKLLDDMGEDHQKMIVDLVPQKVSLGSVQRVLQNLLSERISIRDLPTILEGINEAVGFTQNVNAITEHVRARLSRQISDTNTTPEGYIPIVTLSAEWEQSFAESVVGKGEDLQLSMPPSRLQDFIKLVREVFDRQAMIGESPVLLTSPRIRPYVRSVIERFRPTTVVMSQNEVHPKAKIKTLGQV